MIEGKILIERDLRELEQVMDALIDAHHDEEPVVFWEDWDSRTAYVPKMGNHSRWSSNGYGLPATLT